MKQNKAFLLLSIFLTAFSCNNENHIVQEKLRLNDKIIQTKYYTGSHLDSSITSIDNKVIERILYNTKGLHYYQFNNLFDSSSYMRLYSEGEFKMAVGKPNFFGFTNKFEDNSQSLTNKDTIMLYFFAPTVPEATTELFIDFGDTLVPRVYHSKNISSCYLTIQDPSDVGVWRSCFSMIFKEKKSSEETKQKECVVYKVEESK